MKPAVAYQGGKARLAAAIVDYITNDVIITKFHDLCCGSGAVAIEMVSRGFDPKHVSMIDCGPWGVVWELIGEGHFSLGVFKSYVDQVPKNLAQIRDFMVELSRQPASIDTPYVFLLLQAAAFGGKAIWIEDGKWSNCGFRSYWLPTETSNRRSPVNPLMPMPGTLYDRLEALCEGMHGVTAACMDCWEASFRPGDVAYIDPPYECTAGYGGESFDVVQFAHSLKIIPCYVSEGRALSKQAICLSKGRDKGGMSGNRVKANEEWLSRFN